MSIINMYHAGVMLRGAVMDCDVALAESIVKSMREQTHYLMNGVVGGPNAAKDLPHRTVVELVTLYNLDVMGYVTPTMCEKCKKIVGLDVFDTLKDGTKRATLAVCHIVPRIRGGATENGNLALGCAKCNSDVKDNMSKEMVESLKKIFIFIEN